MTEPIHPMQPSPEQFADWFADAMHRFPAGRSGEVAAHVARKAYAVGADAELEACCEELNRKHHSFVSRNLRAVRRPKPPSLKEQALAAIKRLERDGDFFCDQMKDLGTIHSALEALNDD